MQEIPALSSDPGSKNRRTGRGGKQGQRRGGKDGIIGKRLDGVHGRRRRQTDGQPKRTMNLVQGKVVRESQFPLRRNGRVGAGKQMQMPTGGTVITTTSSRARGLKHSRGIMLRTGRDLAGPIFFFVLLSDFVEYSSMAVLAD